MKGLVTGIGYNCIMEIFLSHATADRHLVETVKTQLAALEVKVYTAEHDNQAGQNVHSKVQEAIRRCDAVVVLLTQAGYSSGYVHEEIGFAQNAAKPTIPLVTSAAIDGGLNMLEGVEYIKLDDADASEGLQRLGQRIEELIAQQQLRQQNLILAGALLVLVGIVLLDAR